MKIIGRLVQVLQVKEYNSQKGTNVKGGFVIETQEQYPKKICFDLWGQDKCNAVGVLPMNTLIEVSFDLASREYQGKWYTDVRCFKVDYANQQQFLSQQPQMVTPQEPDFIQQMLPQTRQQQPQTQVPQQQPQMQAPQQAQQGMFNVPPMQEERVLPF